MFGAIGTLLDNIHHGSPKINNEEGEREGILMGHLKTVKEDGVYMLLAERLSKNPIGVAITEDLMKILHCFYTESEARVGSKFPMVPMPVDKLAGITGIEEEALKKTLDSMAQKTLVLILPTPDGVVYMLSPMVVGFFEFSFMHVPKWVGMKELSALFNKYLEDPAARKELWGTDPAAFRSLVYEKLIPVAVQTEILDYEKASEIIRQAGYWAVGLCTCRHMASHLGTPCKIKNSPMETCTLLGDMAQLAVHNGWAREATMDEMLQILEQTTKLGMAHTCDNVLNHPAFLCHCCSCCCLLMSSIKEFGISCVLPSNFIPVLDAESCLGCEICAKKCPAEAITMRDGGKDTEVPGINMQRCIGCGVCASVCPEDSLTMSRRPGLYAPPKDTAEQITLIGQKRGRI